MDKKTFAIALPLGAVCAIGPFATDMHLSAMPRMAADLGATDATIQLNMMTYFVGFTIGQLFYGPVSDRTGRKPMIYLALLLFCLGSMGAFLAGSAHQLLAFRFVQGFGGSIGMVISTAAVRDLYTGHAAAKLMSLVVLVLGIAPVVAPLAGSVILQIAGWRPIFATVFGLGLLVALIVTALLPETRMAELRAQSKPSTALKWYGHLLVSRNFMPYAGTLAMAQGGFFTYIAGSSFVLMGVYDLSPVAYSLIFALNAVGIGIGTQIGPRIAHRVGSHAMVKACTLIYAAAAVLLFAMELSGISNLVSVCMLLFIMVMALGGIMPTCNILAMEAHGAIAGTAAALMGALGFGAGALGSFGIGILENGSAMPMIAVIMACAVATTIIAHLTFGEEKGHQAERA